MLDHIAEHTLRARKGVFRANTAAGGIASLDGATSFDAEKGLINIFNSATVNSEAVWIVPIYIRLTCQELNDNATNFTLAGYLDNIDRYSSGGTALTPKASSLSAETNYTNNTSKATVYAGSNVLAAASSSVLQQFDVTMSQAALAVDESLTLLFDGQPKQNLGDNVMSVAPVFIGPGGNLSIHEVAAGQTADPKFEMEICWVESGHPQTT